MSEFLRKLIGNRQEKEHGRVENLFQKSVRHVLTGDFKLETLKRGAEQVKLHLETREISRAVFEATRIEHDFCEQSGVDVFYYTATIPNQENIEERIIVTEFPEDTHLEMDYIKSEYHSRLPSEYLEKRDAIAAFVGPTIRYDLPNNGFFSRDQGGMIVDFQDTNPPGQRRGAIAITDSGELELFDEEQKLTKREDSFEGYQFVVGTSFYFTSEDPDNALEIMQYADRSQISYFMQFRTKSGEVKTGHILVRTMLSRRLVKRLLDYHAETQGWKSYFAVELELNGSDCLIKDEDGNSQSVLKGGYHLSRQDHYFIVRD